MSDPTSASLPELAAKYATQVNELRRAGDLAALLASAKAAADEIERRAGEDWSNAAEREALTRVQRFTFNAAADCWPGWAESDRPADAGNLMDALALAQRSTKLVAKLGLGKLQDGTGT